MRQDDRWQALALVLTCAVVALVASAILIGSTPDDEEFRFAVLSTWLHMQSVASGSYALWTSQLGFGIPQPFVPNFNFHPLAPALAFVSPVLWVRAFLFAHTVAGALGVWMIGRRLEMAPLARSACVATLLLSAPVQNYLLTDFWPSHYVVWTSTPWLLLLAWRALEDEPATAGRWSILLGLASGLVLASTNPGHAIVYVTLVLALLLAHWRALRARWAWMAAAAIIAAAIVSPNLLHLAAERRLFGSAFGVSNLPETLPLASMLDVFLRPWTHVEGVRVLWFGGPFAALALLAMFWFRIARRDLVLCLVLSAIVLFVDAVPVGPASARYQFRDPLTLSATVLAGLAADRLLRTAATRWIGIALVAAQLAIVSAAAWPFLQQAWEPEALHAMAFRGATAQTALVDRLVSHLHIPGRVLFSPQVDHAVAERTLLRDGLGVNALAYRGVSVVNGSYKGASANPIWPDDRLFYGRVRAPQAFVASKAGLDVLGIRYVIARRAEPIPSELQLRDSFTTLRGDELMLYENADAWPGAFLVDAAFGDRELPILPGCENDRLFCRDFAEVARAADRNVSVVREADGIRVTWSPRSGAAVLTVSEMYRAGWVARAGERQLATRVMYGGLLGVPLPPGVSSVELRYRPRVVVLSQAVAYAAIVLGLLVLVRAARPRSARP